MNGLQRIMENTIAMLIGATAPKLADLGGQQEIRSTQDVSMITHDGIITIFLASGLLTRTKTIARGAVGYIGRGQTITMVTSMMPARIVLYLNTPMAPDSPSTNHSTYVSP